METVADSSMKFIVEPRLLDHFGVGMYNLSGKAVTIVTADTGMALRGEAQGLPTISMPDETRRD